MTEAWFPEQRNVGAVGTVGRFRCRITELSKNNGAAAPAASAVVANVKKERSSVAAVVAASPGCHGYYRRTAKPQR